MYKAWTQFKDANAEKMGIMAELKKEEMYK